MENEKLTVEPLMEDKPSTLFQVGTYFSLINAVYNGDCNFTELAQHGDFGLGTLDNIDGEMIAFDGVFYKIQADKTLQVVNHNEITPFANVTFFKPSIKAIVTNIQTFSELAQTIEKKFPNKNIPYALRFDAQCDYIRYSISRGQKKPYPLIEEVKKWR